MSDVEQNFDDALVEPLTRREREILGLLDQGLSAPEMAEKLTLAVSSVKWHIQHLYGKLGVSGKRAALTRARELGLLDAPGSAATAPTPGPTGQPARHARAGRVALSRACATLMKPTPPCSSGARLWLASSLPG